MGNLGGFAGGLARGLEAGHRMNVQDEELAQNKQFRERQLKMQEQDAAWQEEQRAKERELQAGMKALQDKHYGPREVEDGETMSEDAAGNIVRIPKMKKVPGMQFGQDPTRDVAFTADAIGLKLAKTGDIAQLAPMLDYVQKAKATEQGRKVFSALTGNKKDWDELVTAQGGDPTKAKFDPKTYEVDLGNGKRFPVKEHLFAVGADRALEFIRQTEKDNMTREHYAAQNKHLDAQTGLVQEEQKIIPEKGNLLRAQTGLANAKRAAVNAKGAAGGTVTAAVSNAVKAATMVPGMKEHDPDAYAYVLGEVAGSKNPSAAISQATQKFRDADSEFSSTVMPVLKKMPKDQLVKKFGTSDLKALRRLAIQKKLGQFKEATVADGNLGADTEDAE